VGIKSLKSLNLTNVYPNNNNNNKNNKNNNNKKKNNKVKSKPLELRSRVKRNAIIVSWCQLLQFSFANCEEWVHIYVMGCQLGPIGLFT
jgi:hypothetical protein